MRKLASIQEVINLTPIEGADRIETARVLGWNVVVQKGLYEVGDKVVFFEPDSVPPDDDRFSFLWDKKSEGIDRPEKYRLKTMKLRGQLSQGLLMPLEEVFGGWTDWTYPVGEDVTELLGVTKYEPPIPPGLGEVEGAFNFQCSKTDEARIQSNIALLDEMAGLDWISTIKYDGTSATFGINKDGEFAVSGRNWRYRDGDNMFWNVVRRMGVLEAFETHSNNYIFQGELCGPGIQKNHLGLKDLNIFIFDVYDREAGTYLVHDEMLQICNIFGFDTVEVDLRGTNFDLSVETLLGMAEGVYSTSQKKREGIVVRPSKEVIYSETIGGRLSFKAINNEFLLKESD